MNRPLSLKPLSLSLTASLCAVLMSGCANFAGTAGPSIEPATASLSGTVYGGSQIIGGSTMKLWAAGNSGYGAGAVQLGSTVTSNATTGAWSIGSYSCPTTAASQMLYVTAQGGVTGGQSNNANIFLLVALGPCSSIQSANPKVQINEATTIAAMAALHNFATTANAASGGGVILGAPSTNLTGLKNAFATANNLVPYTAGQGVAFNTTGTVTGFSTSPTVTVTPEFSKNNLEANILASCVEAAGNCATLFADVTSSQAIDTLQAAYYMQTNITSTVGGNSNIAALVSLAAATSPFQPALATTPTDWTLGITYGSNSTNTAGQYFMSGPEYLAVDSTGNVWFANYVSGTVATNNSVSEISPAGVPSNQVLVGAIEGPAGIVIDPSNNIWVPNYGTGSVLQSSVTEYVSSSGATNTYTVDKGAQAIASDGAGDIFTLSPSYKSTGSLDEIVAGTASGATATQLATGLTTDFSNLAVDGNFTVWVTGGGTGSLGGTTGYPYLYQFLYSSASSPHYPSTPSATTNAGTVTAPENAIAIDNSNDVFIANYGKNTISELSGTSSIAGNANSPIATSATLTKPEFSVIDGAGSYWVTNALTVANGGGSVFGYSNSGAALTPTGGLAHTYAETYGIAVDGSGNIWVGNYASSASSTVQAYITEIVGAAVPVVTPISAGLPAVAGGTNRIGTKP